MRQAAKRERESKGGQEREREGETIGRRDETFMRLGVGVRNHNENAKIELFSRTERGVMRVKTAWRRVGEGRKGR